MKYLVLHFIHSLAFSKLIQLKAPLYSGRYENFNPTNLISKFLCEVFKFFLVEATIASYINS